ncbi:MAG: hypothetical protein L0Y80_06650 [Ignavibacteriae bacterium]|nr:hypothetical protein [Ignavibacteriota bacterium]
MLFKKVTIATVLLIILISGALYGQHIPSKERGDPKYRRKAQMEGNQIRATIFNYGMAGREGGVPITEQTPFEWPKNTGQVYLAVMGILVGAEVVDNVGQTQRIISRMHYLSSPEGRSWNFEPVGGYFNEANPDGFATSNLPETWPSSWPDKTGDVNDPGWAGKWNGYFGKDIFNADQEMFFHASDNLYDKYTNYFPDTTDLTRKGLGIILDTRVMTWSQLLVQDAMFFLFKIRNDGTEPLDKVGVTIAWADFVGGDGGDDISEFDLLNDIAWSRDSDLRGPDFGNNPVGIVAGAFLETPGNALDRIDNDGDSPEQGPRVTEAMLAGEGDLSIQDPKRYDGVDNNGNGLIDENLAHVPFGTQVGVTYADGIGQPIDPLWLTQHTRFSREENSPLVTLTIVNQAAIDVWKRWPPAPESDVVQDGAVHLIMVESDDIGLPFKDNIDNDANGEGGSPTITQSMIDAAVGDPFLRYKVNAKVILYNVTPSTLGMKYADGVDNDNDGAVDENIDEGIDVLIDESRSDGIDNDYDWDAITNDVGLDGVASTGDGGEGDGEPTSGARFGLPGEPGIDVTDVSETDQIGITGSFYRPSGEWIDQYADSFIWNNFMVPGTFIDSSATVADDYNLFISSGLFSLQPGQTEPISLAVILANGPIPDDGGQIRKAEILRKRGRAQETYNNDYQFANAPATPTLTAVPGNNRVTLYWDDAAESSFDRYISNIGGNGNDFEGYRIYRSSDPAFQDALQITNAQGVPTFRLPIAQFDLKDGVMGYDSVGFDGVHFYLGNDSGIQHSFVDSSVRNGFTYYYAITSYDFGYIPGQIIPSECDISIALNPDGTVKSAGRNVAQVTPAAPAAGYVPPTLGEVELATGFTTAKIYYSIVDPEQIKDGHVYRITFEDTVKVGTSGKPDTLTTKNYTVFDSTANMTVIDKSTKFGAGVETPLVDGIRLEFINEIRLAIDPSKSGWSDPTITPFVFQRYSPPGFAKKGEERPNDYEITFGETGLATSTAFNYNGTVYPSMPVNFRVYNRNTEQFIQFGFLEFDNTGPNPTGWFSSNGGSRQDRIVFLEPSNPDTGLTPTWWFFLDRADSLAVHKLPVSGDAANITLTKPFLSSDVFRFVATSGYIDVEKARKELENIKVVPNPYLANALWEPKNPYTSGRGPRAIHFTHLPSKCTIRIFTISGELVDEIQHDNPFGDGTATWDLLTRDNLSVSYGVYIYHVDAPGIGQKSGKFAIIK